MIFGTYPIYNPRYWQSIYALSSLHEKPQLHLKSYYIQEVEWGHWGTHTLHLDRFSDWLMTCAEEVYIIVQKRV